MEPIDFEILRRALEHPNENSRGVLFAGLAASRAAWRARAAEGLLKPHASEGAG